MNIKKPFRTIFVFVFLSKILLAQTPGAYLGELTWPEAEQRLKSAPLVILPFAGGAKEHGPHLPMNADRKVMEYLCRKAVEALPVIVAPPILHGWFAAFRDFPGTEVSCLFKDGPLRRSHPGDCRKGKGSTRYHVPELAKRTRGILSRADSN